MDGTMVDSMPWHARSWKVFAREAGVAPPDMSFFRRTTGLTGVEVMREFFGERPVTELRALVERKEAIYREMFGPEFREVRGFGAFADAARAAGVKVACATAGDADNIAFVLDHLGRHDFFDAVVGAHDVERGKPHPDLFLLAAQRIGVDPTDCLVFEDAPHGIEAARRAGMRAVAIATTLPPDELGAPDHVIARAVDFVELDLSALLCSLATASQP
jgi:HAD superfamily hydrolase (TIGR01549 family)